MKKHRILANTLLAFAGTALFSCSSQAITADYSDLILGFQVVTLFNQTTGVALPAQPGGGSSTNLMINLGAASQFYNPATTSFTLPAVVLQDLVDTYGVNWSTRTDLAWGIMGTTGRDEGTPDGHATLNTVWTTVAESTPGIQSTAPGVIEGNKLRVAIGNFESTITAGSAFSNASPTANSASAAAIARTEDSSWTVQIGDAGNFGLPGTTIEGWTTISAGGYSVLDLYELQGANLFNTNASSTTYLGSFGLNSNGVLTFSTDADLFAAVPEPSTYALVGIAGCLWAFNNRRRRAAIVNA